jgi:ribosome maturation protein Sdo1
MGANPHGSGFEDGEYVEVKNFLNRHTVYKQVEGGATAESDDIPF